MTRSATENYLPFAARSTVAGFAMMLMLAACGAPETSVEEQLRGWVEAGQAAAEAKDRSRLMSMISPAYSDNRGLDQDDVANRFRLYFLRQNTIKLLVSIDEIRVFDDTAAEIDLRAGLAGTNDGALGFSASAYRFKLELEQSDDGWQLISARWGRLGEEVY